MTDLIAVTVTGPDVDQVQQLCRRIVTARLAACANITPQIQSMYWWDGQVQQAPEAMAVLHTTTARFDDLATVVQAEHPYDVAQVTALPLRASAAYGQWIRHETTPP